MIRFTIELNEKDGTLTTNIHGAPVPDGSNPTRKESAVAMRIASVIDTVIETACEDAGFGKSESVIPPTMITKKWDDGPDIRS